MVNKEFPLITFDFNAGHLRVLRATDTRFITCECLPVFIHEGRYCVPRSSWLIEGTHIVCSVIQEVDRDESNFKLIEISKITSYVLDKVKK